MNMKKLTKRDKILIGVLIALIIIVIGVGAFLIVSNTNSANEQAAKLTSSSSSDSKETTSSKSSSDKTSSDNNSSSAKPDKSSSSDSNSSPSADAGANNSSKTTSSKTSSNSKVKGDKVKREKPTENTSHASSKTLTVNGKTCYVGDTITVVLNITSQKTIVNYQGTLSFDNKYLKLKEVKSNNFGVANFDGTNILYNASAINGMNFSETGTVFTATFEVKNTGSTTVKNDLEIISELVNNSIKQLSSSDYKATVEIYS